MSTTTTADPTKLPFVKMHGAGNDFVVIDGRHPLPFDLSKLAIAACDRHFGIGADGLIVLQGSQKADFRMLYFNADGGAAVCGNGVRCLARFIYQSNLVSSETKKMQIEIDSGNVSVEIIGRGERSRVDMGTPKFGGKLIPTTGEGEQVQVPLVVDGKKFQVTAVSMGNPHCVIFLDHHPDSLDLEGIGPKIEHHSFFPQRANVEFAQVLDSQHVVMRVWERGVGETLACGTGVCAVLAAGVKENRTDRHIVVATRGGEFEVSWNEQTGKIKLLGPAEEVYRGSIDPLQLLRRWNVEPTGERGEDAYV